MIKKALFDFDETITKKDTFKELILYFANSDSWRVYLLYLTSPIWMIFLHGTRYKEFGVSIPLYISTVFKSKKGIIIQAKNFCNQFENINLLNEGVAELVKLEKSGFKIFIVTAGPSIISKMILKRYLSNFVVISSRFSFRYCGLVQIKRCYGENKKEMLIEKNVPKAEIAYGNNASDFPMISLGDVKYLINPKKKLRQRAIDQFSEINFVYWQ